MNDQNKTSTGRAWLCALIIIFSGFFFGMMIKKIAGTAALLMPAFGIGPSSIGSLVSAISVISVFLALPIGGVIAKYGARKLILLAFALAIIGNVMGALSPTQEMLVVSRIIEGAGFGIFAPAAPSLIASYFPPDKRGLPMGIWSTYVGTGGFLVLVLTNVLVDFNDPNSWANVWWFIVIAIAILAILFFIFVHPATPAQDAEGKKDKHPFVEGLKSLPSWLLAASFMLYNCGFIALTTFMPTYLKTVLMIDPASANLYTSVLTFLLIVGGFVAGFILKKIKPQNKPILYLVSMICSGIIFSFSFVYGANMIMVFSVLGGLILQFIPAIMFNNAPDTAPHPALIGVAMGIMSLGQNIGGLIAGTFSGTIIESFGWSAMTFTLIGLSVLAVIVAALYALSMKKRGQKKAAIKE